MGLSNLFLFLKKSKGYRYFYRNKFALSTRLFDNYLSYLSELVALVLKTDSEIIKSEPKKQISFELILEYKTLDDLLPILVEKRIEELSLVGMDPLEEFFSKKLGLKLFRDKKEYSDVLLFRDFRNLIVHNRSTVDKKFKKNQPEWQGNVGDKIDFKLKLVQPYISLISLSVLRLDEKAVKKFNLPTFPKLKDWLSN